MGLTNTLKDIDSIFLEVYINPIFHKFNNALFKNTCMSINLEPKYMEMKWFVSQDRYCMIIKIENNDKIKISTWDMTYARNTWNDDFDIELDIERSYFDCLNMVYPMTTNFKFKHLAILKSIAEQYTTMRGLLPSPR